MVREVEKPDGAGLDGFLDDVGHRGEVVGGGIFVLLAALAHGIEPDRAVGDLRTDIERVLAAVDVVEVFGKGLPPAPFHAFVQRRAGDVLDTLHQLDEFLLAAGRHRREAHTAVAHDDGGDAVVRRRRHL